ncbi:MAG: deoxyhypusine synthase family protein [Acidobacteriota bacterium]
MSQRGPISQFIAHHYRHFNAAALLDAARAYEAHLECGGKMMITLAGAMSTAELGLSLAELIRRDKVHAISCTGANLEEDLFNLVAHDHYERIPEYRDLTPAQEEDLLRRHLNRVTDTCIPEEEAMRRLERIVGDEWKRADAVGERYFPHEFLYRTIRSGRLEEHYQIDPADSWMIAAAEKNLPLFVPGWEDSTLGNVFAAHLIRGDIQHAHTMRSGIEYMTELADWYQRTTGFTQPANSADGNSRGEEGASVGFFQIGGGIAGDFPICVVPMLHQDLFLEGVPMWGYFCQISDSTTSYGSYSGAVPNEKITWGKLEASTPKFIIESDATIVAPLVFAWLLGW